MSWAAGRRALILAIVGVIVLIIIGIVAYSVLHKAPSCIDGEQNQDEEGVDCGGVCTYLCTAGLISPSVSFVRELPQAGGRTDIIAYIKNPNASAAARGARYVAEVYDANQVLLVRKEGVTDLAPGSDTVIFLPNVYSGSASSGRAFLTIDDTSYKWTRYTGQLHVPLVGNPQVTGTTDAPRVVASITNPFATPLRNIKLTATVFDEAGNAIAASQTVIPELAAQAATNATFTWNAPFPSMVSRIEVKPAAPLTP